ncbi:hypothetical protein [Streptobacillus ratti]|uniref:hypothetical protein n=1 Tax=Streptobacillus ratti TaxID=1720557 RepID=UPI000933B337|nr:hypothetical protein [Streptobacillus ratti]
MESKKVLDIINKSKSLKSIIGTENIKSINDNLSKGDIIIYNEQLYKCKNPGNYSLPDVINFKKIGLRYIVEEYDEQVVSDMESLYQSIYEKGINGDNQGRNWDNSMQSLRQNNNINYSFYPKNIKELKIYDSSSEYGDKITLRYLFDLLKKYAKTNDVYEIVEFPIVLNSSYNRLLDTITKDNLEEKLNNKYYIGYLSAIKLKTEIFNKAIEKEYEEIKEYSKSPKMMNNNDFVYFDIRNLGTLNNYETMYYLNESENKNYFLKEFINKYEYRFGVYQKTESLNYEISKDDINLKLDYYVSSSTNRRDDGSEYNSYYRHIYLKFEKDKIVKQGEAKENF